MELLLFTIQDTKAGYYDRPFAARSKPEAIRLFQSIATDEQHPIGQHPEDYVLYYCGTFSQQTGAVLGDGHEALCKGSDFLSNQPPSIPLPEVVN